MKKDVHLRYTLPVAIFIVFLIAILAVAISKIPEEERRNQLSFVIEEDNGRMKTFEVNTEPNYQNPTPTRDNTNRYDENYLEYLDDVQEARDNTFSGR